MQNKIADLTARENLSLQATEKMLSENKRHIELETMLEKETYAESDFLPFCLLLERTRRPPVDSILDLKPCLFFLFLLLGWYVLFIKTPVLFNRRNYKQGGLW